VNRELVHHLEDRGVNRVIMDDGANALNLPLLAALRERISGLRADGARPLLLASSHPNLFCPGWDLKALADAPREQVGEGRDVACRRLVSPLERDHTNRFFV